MLIDTLAHMMAHAESSEHIFEMLDAGEDATLGIASSARPFLVATRFAYHPQPTLVVLSGEEASYDFARMVEAYLGEQRVYRFFEREDTPFLVPKELETYSASTKISQVNAKKIAHRMRALHALSRGDDCVVVASARSLLRLFAPIDNSIFVPIHFDRGADITLGAHPMISSYEDITRALVFMGYEHTDVLSGPATFALNGDTLDIFPAHLDYPVRVEFFGDEVDEIRRIVPSTGQTISSLDELDIFAAREFGMDARAKAHAREVLCAQAESSPAFRSLLERLDAPRHDAYQDALLPFAYSETTTLFDHVSDDTLTVLIEPRSLIDDALRAYDVILARAQGGGIAPELLYREPARLDFGDNQRLTLASIMRVGAHLDEEIAVKRTEVSGGPDKLFGRMLSLVQQNYMIIFSVPQHRAREEMKLALVDRGIPILEILDAYKEGYEKLKRGCVCLVYVEIPLGLIIPKAKLALISISDTQSSKHARVTKRVDITEVTFPYSIGDYVVHASHGIALFKDIVRQDVAGVMRDYLLLEYAGNDKLYVPVEQLDRVTRYVGPEGSTPRLTRLGQADWTRALTRAYKASRKLAFDLIDVYTRRSATLGFRYGRDTPWQQEMEDAFPYEETADQLQAIEDIKADMMSSRPMDRLICGDVGFGKTEVAMRAAFKATQADKQVMVLCPTTILAQQHFSTFYDRFEPFDVRVAVLSRFTSTQEEHEILEAFASGEVSVLVGTHRLLSRDVNPHDLGLVIIDEEQRFGVGHKEQLKNLRESIDVLTLSATPIPRTMQMSLSGVRDMSLILTPPGDRRPVEVHVGEWDPDIVSMALRRELARRGQVYYVSNRVRSIDEAVRRVEAAAPEARVGVAHGQLSKDELEEVMEEFSAGLIDVLVATTIIESGIDNPHTNTLIIEDSQRLGLAQMYQLKGRVGRSNLQAYAYFMFPDNIPLTEEAMARLEAINEHTELGSGMRIAMRDLEIRGAGSMLGAEQSGNMSAVGFDLFAQMLHDAVTQSREGVSALKETGEAQLPAAPSDITINVPVHAYLSEEYLPYADERVMWYRRIASITEVSEAEEYRAMLAEKHPDMPEEAANLFERARVRALAIQAHIRNVSIVANKLTLEGIRLDPKKLTPYRRYGARYIADKERFTLPLRYFEVHMRDKTLFEAVVTILEELMVLNGTLTDDERQTSSEGDAVSLKTLKSDVGTAKTRTAVTARGVSKATGATKARSVTKNASVTKATGATKARGATKTARETKTRGSASSLGVSRVVRAHHRHS